MFEVSMNRKYMVMVLCLTYNHELYLEDALKGFVMQKTNFPFIAVVIDDCSTDGTANILHRYEEMYPDIIKAVYLPENYYSQGKSKYPFYREYQENSKYIALCEGDDYWTDPLKLQKQVDYLETHDECAMCAHAANWEVNGIVERNDVCHGEECDLTTYEVIERGGLYLATASLIFRREVGDIWPNWRKKANVGDYPLQILGTLQGKIHYFPDIMCVYRYLVPGSWTERYLGQKEKNLDYLCGRTMWLLELNEDTKHKYEKAVCTSLLKCGYSELFVAGRISLRQYLYAMKKGHRSKKMNHFIKEMCARYLGVTI